MKNCAVGAILAAVALAGCKPEAERFGYKGVDLDEGEMEFFTTGGGCTNYVPSRVINVYEKYEFTADELRLIESSGVSFPSETFVALPEGYRAAETGPWFTTYEKDGELFGAKGKFIFIAHRNDDGKFLTAESSFSTYWPDKAAALAALVALKDKIAVGFAPKKIYDFEDCFVAEYVRLRVLGIVGQKADGVWTCMLCIQDKCRTGCGSWEPYEEQQSRLNRENYRKAMAKWREQVTGVLSANHEAVEKLRLAAGIRGFGADAESRWRVSQDCRAYQISICGERTVPPEADTDADAFFAALWRDLSAEIKLATGIDFPDAPGKSDEENGWLIGEAFAASDIYEARAALFVPKTVSNGESGSTVESGSTEERPVAQWQILCGEKLQKGFVLPERPLPVQ